VLKSTYSLFSLFGFRLLKLLLFHVQKHRNKLYQGSIKHRPNLLMIHFGDCSFHSLVEHLQEFLKSTPLVNSQNRYEEGKKKPSPIVFYFYSWKWKVCGPTRKIPRETSGEAIGSRKRCVFLHTREPNLLIIRRWGTRMGNYWKMFFFQKKKDGEEKQKTLGDALIYLSDHTFAKVPYYKNTTGIILIWDYERTGTLIYLTRQHLTEHPAHNDVDALQKL